MCTVVNLLFSLASNRLVPTLLQTGKNHVRLIIAFDQLKLQENIPYQLVLAGNDRDRADEVHQVAEKASCTNCRYKKPCLAERPSPAPISLLYRSVASQAAAMAVRVQAELAEQKKAAQETEVDQSEAHINPYDEKAELGSIIDLVA